MLRPREPNHHSKPVARRFVQQIVSWRCVRADRVDTEAGHQAEVFGDLFQRGELVSVGIGCERSVCHTLYEEPGSVRCRRVLRFGRTQKFSVHDDARVRTRRSEDTNLGTGNSGLDCGAHNRQ
jgi:hypothetical protein